MASHELEMMEKIRIQVGDSNNAVIDNDDCIVFHVTNQLEGCPDSRVNPTSQGVSKAKRTSVSTTKTEKRYITDWSMQAMNAPIQKAHFTCSLNRQ